MDIIRAFEREIIELCDAPLASLDIHYHDTHWEILFSPLGEEEIFIKSEDLDYILTRIKKEYAEKTKK